jgi:hypothetical protein
MVLLIVGFLYIYVCVCVCVCVCLCLCVDLLYLPGAELVPLYCHTLIFPLYINFFFFGLTGLGDLCASTAIQDTHFQWIGGMCKMIS